MLDPTIHNLFIHVIIINRYEYFALLIIFAPHFTLNMTQIITFMHIISQTNMYFIILQMIYIRIFDDKYNIYM